MGSSGIEEGYVVAISFADYFTIFKPSRPYFPPQLSGLSKWRTHWILSSGLIDLYYNYIKYNSECLTQSISFLQLLKFNK